MFGSNNNPLDLVETVAGADERAGGGYPSVTQRRLPNPEQPNPRRAETNWHHNWPPCRDARPHACRDLARNGPIRARVQTLRLVPLRAFSHATVGSNEPAEHARWRELRRRPLAVGQLDAVRDRRSRLAIDYQHMSVFLTQLCEATGSAAHQCAAAAPALPVARLNGLALATAEDASECLCAPVASNLQHRGECVRRSLTAILAVSALVPVVVPVGDRKPSKMTATGGSRVAGKLKRNRGKPLSLMGFLRVVDRTSNQ